MSENNELKLSYFTLFKLTDGFQIVTENYTATGEVASIRNYKSLLQLNNVTKKMPTKFQCMDGNLNETAIRTSIENAPILSFNVIGIRQSVLILYGGI